MNSSGEADLPGVSQVMVQLHDGHAARETHWGVAEEAAVEINVNGQPLAVTMASPTALQELAVGFVYTEGVVRQPNAIQAVNVAQTMEGWIVDVQLPVAAVDDTARRGRMLEGRAGCGLCGVDSLSAAMRRPPLNDQVTHAVVSNAAISRAFAALAEHQPLNQATRSVHAAAWCNLEGDIKQVCEDVGRHNALDKLAGWAIREGATYPGFVLLSSRVSYELVCKSAALGSSLLAAVSAPTTLAIELARQAGLPMAFAGPQGTIARISHS